MISNPESEEAPASKSGRTERRIGVVVMVLLALGFFAVIGAGIAATATVLRAQQDAELVEHTQAVQATIAEIALLIERKETARRGYLIEQDERFRSVHREIAGQIPMLLARLNRLVADNPEQARRAERLRASVAQHRVLVRRSLAQIDAGEKDAATMAFATDPSTMLTRDIRDQTREMAAIETRLMSERSARQDRNVSRLFWVLGLAGLLLVVVGVATMFTVRRYIRSLAASRDALGKLNANLEAAVEERTVDLQRANDEIQRFAYIVSHDLRSPLVNVMGFTSELDAARAPLVALVEKAEAEAPQILTKEARLAATEDLPEAIGFIRTSTQKMDRLINAILKLSREGRRTITPESIDTGIMLREIADGLRHRADAIGATITVADDLPVITSDRLALEQIFSNLVENAIKYLKPGRPGFVSIGAERAGRRVIFSVADNGRGVDPRDHQRIFDLFRRSGAQDQPGEGIGLAHVRSLAYRLGGVITIESALDEGATFRLSLPAHFQGDRGQRQ